MIKAIINFFKSLFGKKKKKSKVTPVPLKNNDGRDHAKETQVPPRPVTPPKPKKSEYSHKGEFSPNGDMAGDVLLQAEAHMRRISPELDEKEYDEYIKRVKAAGVELYTVDVPDWPPVKRPPLQVMMGSDRDPFENNPFSGRMLAFTTTDDDISETGQYSQNLEKVINIGWDMVPADEDFSEKRLSYQWQCGLYDPKKHIIIREYLDENDLDIVEFYGYYDRASNKPEIIEVANPNAKREYEEKNQWKPTRRVFDKKSGKKFFKEFADSLSNSETKIINGNHDSGVGKSNPTQTGIYKGSKIYTGADVADSLNKFFPKKIRFFGKGPSDGHYIALSRDNFEKYLKEDKTNKFPYVKDAGERNYDCDNFAESLRVHFSEKYGSNTFGVIWGDRHAWNFVILAGDDKPEILMVEPQTDKIVGFDNGSYAVNKRCEVLL